YDLGAVPATLRKDSPEDRAWFAGRTFTAAFWKWGLDTSLSAMPDFETSPMVFALPRDSLYVQVGALPTSDLRILQARMLHDMGRPTLESPRRAPTVLDTR